MAAGSKRIPNFFGYSRIAIGLVALIYLFGVFWYPSIEDASIDAILIIGLLFRLTFSIRITTANWRVYLAFFFYISTAIHQAIGFAKSGGSMDKLFLSSSAIILFLLGTAFLLDLWQFLSKQFKQVEE